MPGRTGDSENSSRESLVAATLAAWVTHACSELSARGIASSAGLNASAIYYYFDDIEHLYEAAQREAIDRANGWAAMQRDALDGLAAIRDLPASALAPLLVQLIDDWCEQARPLAFAWRECQLLAARNPRFAPLRDRWQALWQDFWAGICGRFGAEQVADATSLFFDGESMLHLMRWNRAVDRACLAESVSTWVRWIDGKLPAPTPWRLHARSRIPVQAGAARAPGENARRIATAAARLLVEKGAGAVTHRAVAADAGLTLGTVSHLCKRTDELLESAYAEVYVQLTGGAPDQRGAPPPPRRPEPARSPDPFGMLAIDELILAVARGRIGSDLVGLLRYLRGNTSVHSVREHIRCSEAESIALAAVYSSAAMGLSRSMHARSGEEAAAMFEGFLQQFAGRMPRWTDDPGPVIR